MSTFTSVGEAMLLAHEGQQHIAAVIAVEVRRRKPALSWLRRSVPLAHSD